MNIAGHIAVAQVFTGSSSRSRTQDAQLLLGSALPDICNIASVRLKNRSTSKDIEFGIELHHKTDSIFHAHQWFRTLMDATMKDLESDNVRRGPARACAHIGPELLLDGVITQLPKPTASTQAAFRTIEDSLDYLKPMVSRDDQEKWSHTLMRLSAAKQPLDYSDPQVVAVRMEKILRHRPRLALNPKEVTLVTAALHKMLPKIHQDTAWLLADLQQTLKSELSNSQAPRVPASSTRHNDPR